MRPTSVVLLLANVGLGIGQELASAVVRIGEVKYYLRPTANSHYEKFGNMKDSRARNPEACTILSIREAESPTTSIKGLIDGFDQQDDVYRRDYFAGCFVVQVTNWDSEPDPHLERYLRGIGASSIYKRHVPNATWELPHGPYFFYNYQLYEAWRLYPDSAGAFVVATVPGPDYDSYGSLDAAAYGESDPSALTVAVPSRLFYNRTPKKPYAGRRLGIKDIIDLKGLKTTASSRAYTSLYPVCSQHADIVQKMIDLGFVIVGKLKTTQFADSEWPTADCVDYHAPFNPRGDGYLTTSGSSAGSAAAVASYDWLDYSLGTDTLGSIRSPASYQGLFAMRPSLGAASLRGVVPYSSKFDTIGGFARTAEQFSLLARALYGKPGEAVKPFKNPKRLLYPTDYWPSPDAPSQAAFDRFISRLEQFLGLRREEVNLEGLWGEHRPAGINTTLKEYLEHAFEWAANFDQWAEFMENFQADYMAKHGVAPILNPQLRFKVDYLPTITADQQKEAVCRLEVYRTWFYDHVLPPAEDGYSNSIMVLPWTTGEPMYRDSYPRGPQNFTGRGFFFYNVATYAEAPELTVPVANTSYISKYTRKMEKMPAVLSVIGSKGSDLMLADLISAVFASDTDEEQSGSQIVLGAHEL